MTSITIATKTIELRKISHSASLSEETHAYTAQVWVDGAHICDVSNHGHGGCDMQHPANGKTHDDITSLNDFIKQNAPKRDTGMVLKGKPFIMEEDLETICGELVNQHLVSKDLRRLLGRTVAYFDPAKNAILSYKKMPPEHQAKVIEITKQRTPDAKILNSLPFEEALALYRKHG